MKKFVATQDESPEGVERDFKHAKRLVNRLKEFECYGDVIILGVNSSDDKVSTDLTYEIVHKIEHFFEEFARREYDLQLADVDELDSDYQS